jgi:transposase
MWTPATRRQHSRDGLRYETDLTDAEWALIEPLMPKPLARGRPREWPLREVMNAIFYVLRGGVAWRLLPTDLPPRTTVYRWFSAWRDTGLFETMNHLLVMADRERVGREASPSAAVLDSQSIKTTESGGPRGYDAGKKVKGRKRQVMVDTDGRGLILEPQPADVQDRDGAPLVLRLSRRSFPFIEGVRRYGLRRIDPCDRDLHHHRDCSQTRRPDRLRGSSAPMGGREVLCLDQPEPAALERPRGHARLR